MLLWTKQRISGYETPDHLEKDGNAPKSNTDMECFWNILLTAIPRACLLGLHYRLFIPLLASTESFQAKHVK